MSAEILDQATATADAKQLKSTIVVVSQLDNLLISPFHPGNLSV